MGTPQRGVKCEGVGKEKVAISDQYLAIIARKRLKIDG